MDAEKGEIVFGEYAGACGATNIRPLGESLMRVVWCT